MTEQQTQQRIDENWQFVQQQVRETASACGRAPDSVRIIGVSKYVDETLTRALTAAGCRDLGESRPTVDVAEVASHAGCNASVMAHDRASATQQGATFFAVQANDSFR